MEKISSLGLHMDLSSSTYRKSVFESGWLTCHEKLEFEDFHISDINF